MAFWGVLNISAHKVWLEDVGRLGVLQVDTPGEENDIPKSKGLEFYSWFLALNVLEMHADVISILYSDIAPTWNATYQEILWIETLTYQY